jgi:hypothetical protein
MVGAALQRESGWHAAASGIAAVTAFQLVLAFAVLEPRTFFSGDAGVKYLQAEALVDASWRSTVVRASGDHVDPAGRFSYLAGNQFDRAADGDRSFYGRYSLLFTLPVSLLLALFGPRGLYLVPILATTATMVLTYHLAARTAAGAAWLAPPLVGACSPMLFYSLDLWEHTLAVMLTTAAVLLAMRAGPTGDWRQFGFAGVSMGAAITVREEIMALLPAGFVVLASVPRGKRLRAAMAAAVGLGLCLLPFTILQWSQSGAPMRLPVLRVLGLVPGKGLSTAAILSTAVELLIPPSRVAILGLAALLVARVAIGRVLLYGLAAGSVAWAAADALVYGRTWARPDALVAAFPALLALLFVRTLRRDGDQARREIRQLLAIAVLFTLAIAVSAPIGTGTVGGAQWGPRFLMPVYPLLATAIAFALARRHEWEPVVERPGRPIAGAIAALALASLALQLQGVRDLHAAKAAYGRVLRATAAVAPGALLVTDVGWLGAVTAEVTSERPLLLVNAPRTGTLAELLPALDAQEIDSLTFVGGRADEAAVGETFARAGWKAGARSVVPLWLELVFTEYRRGA